MRLSNRLRNWQAKAGAALLRAVERIDLVEAFEDFLRWGLSMPWPSSVTPMRNPRAYS